MRRKIWISLCLLVTTVICVFIISNSSIAQADSSGAPGLADDPIVTKSYVDAKVAALVKAELDKLGPIGGGGGSAELAVVTVPFGKKIIVGAGGELIVRNGKAIAYSPDANGLSDMTDGVDIAPGKPITTNHLILFPRADRGVQANPNQKNGLIVLVRGSYAIQ
ncbi:hypothetical protein [Cohnella sp.]|uniref:hypothetical protein n=1 Tax=Cohnella sp. TaxID=1883426 RepID=UPI0035640F47